MPKTNQTPKRDKLQKLVGRNVKAARLRSGLTQSALAEALGLETVTVSRIETGAQLPSIDRLDDIARYLNSSLPLLLSDLADKDAFGQLVADAAQPLPVREKEFVFSWIVQYAQHWQAAAKQDSRDE
jgi:transcriptional regulator with XRE-family HTH domain